MIDVAVGTRSNSPLVPVIGLSFFAVASGFLMSLIPLSLADYNLAPELAHWLASIFYLGLLIGAFFIERVVARIGHRKAFIGFLAMLISTVLLQVAAPTAMVWLVARLIAGIAVAGVFVVVESWLLMASTPKARAKRLGIYMTSLYGGSAVGQLAIKPLGTEGPVPYLFVAGLLLVALMAPLLIKKGQPDGHQSQKLKLSELKNLSQPAVMGCLVSGLVLGPIYGLMPLYIAQTDAAPKTGLLMAVIILGGMAVQPLVSYLSPRMSKSLLMALFCLFGALSIAGVMSAEELPVLMISYLLLGACSFALYPIAITLACDKLDVSKIVSATEIMLLSYSFGSVLGPLFAAMFSDSAHGLPMYLGVCLFATCIYMLIKSSRKISTTDTPIAGL